MFDRIGGISGVGGIPVILSPYAEALVPARKHEIKSWMRESYHRRIQKKWNKRFGTTLEPVMLRTEKGLIVHPLIWEQVKDKLGSAPQKAKFDPFDSKKTPEFYKPKKRKPERSFDMNLFRLPARSILTDPIA